MHICLRGLPRLLGSALGSNRLRSRTLVLIVVLTVVLPCCNPIQLVMLLGLLRVLISAPPSGRTTFSKLRRDGNRCSAVAPPTTPLFGVAGRAASRGVKPGRPHLHLDSHALASGLLGRSDVPAAPRARVLRLGSVFPTQALLTVLLMRCQRLGTARIQQLPTDAALLSVPGWTIAAHGS
jgi:hypothetical protein